MRIKKRFFCTAFFSFEVYSLTYMYMFSTMYYLYEPSFFREKNMLDLTRRGKSFWGRKKEGKRFLITRLLIPFPLKKFFFFFGREGAFLQVHKPKTWESEFVCNNSSEKKVFLGGNWKCVTSKLLLLIPLPLWKEIWKGFLNLKVKWSKKSAVCSYSFEGGKTSGCPVFPP